MKKDELKIYGRKRLKLLCKINTKEAKLTNKLLKLIAETGRPTSAAGALKLAVKAVELTLAIRRLQIQKKRILSTPMPRFPKGGHVGGCKEETPAIIMEQGGCSRGKTHSTEQWAKEHNVPIINRAFRPYDVY